MKAFGRAKIPNVIASKFLIKRGEKKDIFPDVGEEPDLQLQVQLHRCFSRRWKVKSDTVSKPKTGVDQSELPEKNKKKNTSSLESFGQLP